MSDEKSTLRSKLRRALSSDMGLCEEVMKEFDGVGCKGDFGSDCGCCLRETFRNIDEAIESEYVSKAEHEEALRNARDCACKPLKFIKKGIKIGEDWVEPQDGESFKHYIERCYVPRIRDDNNVPVQFGEEVEVHHRNGCVESGILQSFHPNRGSVWILSFVGCDHERLVRYDPDRDVLKRPAAKMYDADGVECKQGKTVWCTLNGQQGEILFLQPTSDDYKCFVRWDDGSELYEKPEQLTHEKPVFDADNVRICKDDTVWDLKEASRKKLTVTEVIPEDDVVVCDDKLTYTPQYLTHKEPDSIERVIQFAREEAAYTMEESCALNEIADRLTALMERGA